MSLESRFRELVAAVKSAEEALDAVRQELARIEDAGVERAENIGPAYKVKADLVHGPTKTKRAKVAMHLTNGDKTENIDAWFYANSVKTIDDVVRKLAA